MTPIEFISNIFPVIWYMYKNHPNIIKGILLGICGVGIIILQLYCIIRLICLINFFYDITFLFVLSIVRHLCMPYCKERLLIARQELVEFNQNVQYVNFDV